MRLFRQNTPKGTPFRLNRHIPAGNACTGFWGMKQNRWKSARTYYHEMRKTILAARQPARPIVDNFLSDITASITNLVMEWCRSSAHASAEPENRDLDQA